MTFKGTLIGLLLFMSAILMILALLGRYDYDVRVVVLVVAIVFIIVAIIVEVTEHFWK